MLELITLNSPSGPGMPGVYAIIDAVRETLPLLARVTIAMTNWVEAEAGGVRAGAGDYTVLTTSASRLGASTCKLAQRLHLLHHKLTGRFDRRPHGHRSRDTRLQIIELVLLGNGFQQVEVAKYVDDGGGGSPARRQKRVWHRRKRSGDLEVLLPFLVLR
jgi:hypothetical protein